MNGKELAEKIVENTSFLSRVECSVLAFLLIHDTDYRTSREIERTMFLRQPEVSMVLSAFRRYKWIKEKSMKKTGGKGRPVKLIKLSKSQDEIFKVLIAKMDKKIQESTKQKEGLKEIQKYLENGGKKYENE